MFQEHSTWVTRAAWLATLAIGVTLWMPQPAAASDDTLPDGTAVLSEMRQRLQADATILRRFAYTRSVVERTLDREGRVTEIRYGRGILARINEGSPAVLDRRPSPDDTWLPPQYAFAASGRVLLVRGVARRATVTFFELRPHVTGIGE